MDSELSTVNCYDPFKEVYDSQLTNQSFTSMLSDACQNYDVTKDCYVMCPENIFAVSPPKSFQNNNDQFNRDFGEQNTNQVFVFVKLYIILFCNFIIMLFIHKLKYDQDLFK